MTITFPRAFPAGIHFNTLDFRLVESVSQSPIGDNATLAIAYPAHRWIGQWRTLAVAGAAEGAMRAWLTSLQGGAKTFYARDTRRCGLFSHASFSGMTLGGSAFAGVASASSFPALDRVTFTAPSGLTIVPGDRFELRTGAWHHLAEVVEGAQAASETAITLTFRAPLPAGIYSSGATLDFAQARVPMRLAGPWSADRAGRGMAFNLSAASAI